MFYMHKVTPIINLNVEKHRDRFTDEKKIHVSYIVEINTIIIVIINCLI